MSGRSKAMFDIIVINKRVLFVRQCRN